MCHIPELITEAQAVEYVGSYHFNNGDRILWVSCVAFDGFNQVAKVAADIMDCNSIYTQCSWDVWMQDGKPYGEF